MGFFKDVLKMTPIGMLSKTLADKPSAQVDKETEAEKLERESAEKRKKQQRAIEGLNPTGTLGAGTPQTTRSKVLGV